MAYIVGLLMFDSMKTVILMSQPKLWGSWCLIRRGPKLCHRVSGFSIAQISHSNLALFPSNIRCVVQHAMETNPPHPKKELIIKPCCREGADMRIWWQMVELLLWTKITTHMELVLQSERYAWLRSRMWEAYVKLTNLVAFSMYQKRLHHHPVVGHIKLGAVLYDSVFVFQPNTRH